MNAACEQEKVHPSLQPPVKFNNPIPEDVFVYDGAVYTLGTFDELNEKYPDLMKGLYQINPGLDWSLEPARAYGAQTQRWDVVKNADNSFMARVHFAGYAAADENTYVVVGRAGADRDDLSEITFGAGPFSQRTKL